MPADQLLATLLRALQQPNYAPEGRARLLSTAQSLFLALSNPLNISLLTSHLLSAPAIWGRPDGLSTFLQVLQCFHGATSLVVGPAPAAPSPQTPHPGSGRLSSGYSTLQRPQPSAAAGAGLAAKKIPREDWIRAVIKGADGKSPRWRHILVLSGLLLGLDGSEHEQSLFPFGDQGGGLRRDTTYALIKALNLAIEEASNTEEDSSKACIVMVATYTSDLLSEAQFAGLDVEGLLPMAVRTALFSSEGFHSGYFLGPIDADVVQSGRDRVTWSAKSSTFARLRQHLSQPLLQAMGPLSRLIARSVEHVSSDDDAAALIYGALEDLFSFARTLATQWRQNKLSEIDASEEDIFVDAEARTTTLPRLWHLLKMILFACVNVLKVIIARTVADAALGGDAYAPFIATQTLHTLRHLSFITGRLGGPNAFTTMVFVTLSAVDMLTQYPEHAVTFLEAIQPRHSTGITTGTRMGVAVKIATATGTGTGTGTATSGRTPLMIPVHPLDRTLDLFFLDTAEHFAAVVALHAPVLAESMLVPAAMPYLDPVDPINPVERDNGGGDGVDDNDVSGGHGVSSGDGVDGVDGGGGAGSSLVPIFEAAHSLTLAVLAVPLNADLTTRLLPFYIDVLLKAFPRTLSQRQFRLAFKTVVRIVSPPSPLSATRPDLPDILLEILRHRVLQPSARPLTAVSSMLPPPPSTREVPRESPRESLQEPVGSASRTVEDAAAAAAKPVDSQLSSLSSSPPPLPPLPPQVGVNTAPLPSTVSPALATAEKAVLVLTIIDSLPFLSMNLLVEWLPLTASLLRALTDETQGSIQGPIPVYARDPKGKETPLALTAESCRERLWEVLSGGEMDVERSQLCVAWWTTRGGREMVLFGRGSHVDDDDNVNDHGGRPPGG